VDAERKRKRGRKRQPEAKPGMPTVFRRSHNLEVAVAPRSFGVAHGAELQAFLHEQLYGAGVKRISGTSFSALTRPSVGGGGSAVRGRGVPRPPPPTGPPPPPPRMPSRARPTALLHPRCAVQARRV
jgi:hypothetical protein